MKKVACIFTVLMLFFTAQPILASCQQRLNTPVAAKGGCCKAPRNKKTKNSPTDNKDCDRSAACNPFAGCSQCQYIAVSRFFYPASIEATVSISLKDVNESVVNGFISDCWHPPELTSYS